MEELANLKGYKIVALTVTNAILLREDCFDKNLHPDLPVECLIDYEGMLETRNMYYCVLHSQMVTSKPLFTRKLNFFDSLYFNFSRYFLTLVNKTKEPFKRPSPRIKILLLYANIFYY